MERIKIIDDLENNIAYCRDLVDFSNTQHFEMYQRAQWALVYAKAELTQNQILQMRKGGD